MKMPGRLLVGHELFSRGNYAKIASSRFLEEKKKGNGIEFRFASYRSCEITDPFLV